MEVGITHLPAYAFPGRFGILHLYVAMNFIVYKSFELNAINKLKGKRLVVGFGKFIAQFNKQRWL